MGIKTFRSARPTQRLSELRRFYVEGVGLVVRGAFVDHAGYDGLILGAEDAEGWEIEFTRDAAGTPAPAPTSDAQIVLYHDDPADIAAARQRLAALGFGEIEPANPYWRGISACFADPDGWPVVLCDLSALRARREAANPDATRGDEA